MTENDPAGPAEAGGPSQEELRAEERRARYMDIGNTMRERIEAIAQEMRAAGWTENAALLQLAAADAEHMQREMNDTAEQLAFGLGAGTLGTFAFGKVAEELWRDGLLSGLGRTARAAIAGVARRRSGEHVHLLERQAEGINDTASRMVVYGGNYRSGKSTFIAFKGIALARTNGSALVLVPSGQRRHFADVLVRAAQFWGVALVLNSRTHTAGFEGVSIVIRDDIEHFAGCPGWHRDQAPLLVDEAHELEQGVLDYLIYRPNRPGQIVLAGDSGELARWRHAPDVHFIGASAAMNPYIATSHVSGPSTEDAVRDIERVMKAAIRRRAKL